MLGKNTGNHWQYIQALFLKKFRNIWQMNNFL